MCTSLPFPPVLGKRRIDRHKLPPNLHFHREDERRWKAKQISARRWLLETTQHRLWILPLKVLKGLGGKLAAKTLERLEARVWILIKGKNYEAMKVIFDA